MRLLKLVIVAYLSIFQSFCMEISETFLDKPYVRYQEFRKESIKPYITEIESSQVGYNLIKQICKLYEKVKGKCAGIIFRHGDQTGFQPRINGGSQVELVIDIAELKDCKYPSIRSSVLHDCFGISGVNSSFTITLAHELIHLKHKLEEMAEVRYDGIAGIPYSVAKAIGIDNIFDKDYDSFHLLQELPELHEIRLNMTELWPNLEERRTVIGPDIDDISEHTLRKSMELPSRFIYQRKDIISLEKKETISKIINEPIVPTECSIKAEVSILTPLDVLLKLYNKDEILASLDDSPILPSTQKIFRIILNNPEDYGFISENVKSFIKELISHEPKPALLNFEW